MCTAQILDVMDLRTIARLYWLCGGERVVTSNIISTPHSAGKALAPIHQGAQRDGQALGCVLVFADLE